MISKVSILFVTVVLVAYRCNCEFDYDKWWPGSKTTAAPVELVCGTGLVPINDDFNGTRSAEIGEIPWEVSVQSKAGGKWAHACGGVVINKDFVLTTAMCVGGGSNNEAFCRSEAGIVDLPKGGWTRRRRDIGFPGQDTPGLKYTMRTHIHPEFDKKTLANNLALIQLAQPFDVAKAKGKINTVCLPQSVKEDHSGEQLYTSGWGAIDGVLEFQPQLVIVKAKHVDCEPTAPPMTNQLCIIEDLDDTMEDCAGDFGGPLFSTNGNTSTLVGIYSSGNGCGANNTAKFVDIKPYLVWIRDTAKPASG